MKEALHTLLENIAESYKVSLGSRNNETQRFAEGLSYRIGSKYVKIMTNSDSQFPTVWGFVVYNPKDKKFKQGDILVPKCHQAPRRNKPRGNIFDDKYHVHWNGPALV